MCLRDADAEPTREVGREGAGPLCQKASVLFILENVRRLRVAGLVATAFLGSTVHGAEVEIAVCDSRPENRVRSAYSLALVQLRALRKSAVVGSAQDSKSVTLDFGESVHRAGDGLLRISALRKSS